MKRNTWINVLKRFIQYMYVRFKYLFMLNHKPALCDFVYVFYMKQTKTCTFWPIQNCYHFADIFKCIFLKENAWISLKISLTFVPKFRINNIPALVQIIASEWATSHYLNQWWLVYRRLYASLDLNESIRCFPKGVWSRHYFGNA